MQRELNIRTTHYGLTVALLWDDSTGETFIELKSADDWQRFSVPADKASDAFAHPFVYAGLDELARMAWA